MSSNEQESGELAAPPNASLALHGTEGMRRYALDTFIYTPYKTQATLDRHRC